MAEPKKRLTSTRTGQRRSHWHLKIKTLAICPRCKERYISHRVCPNCGFYGNTDVLKLADKAKAKEERRKVREEEEKLES